MQVAVQARERQITHNRLSTVLFGIDVLNDKNARKQAAWNATILANITGAPCNEIG